MAEARFSARAGRSLRAQESYLRARNPQAAERLLGEIERVVSLLAANPEMGPRVQGRRLARYWITRRYRYRIIYRVEANGVEILDVLHPRQSDPA